MFTQEGLTNTQIMAGSWKCTHCGTIAKSKPIKNLYKRRKKRGKESIRVSIEYRPVVLTCESCGAKFGRMGTPQDFKRAKNQWQNHNCELSKKQDNITYI